jgi:hypothetical protein
MPRRLPRSMEIDAETRGWVRALIRGEMARRGLTYRDLAGLLTAEGLGENEGNLRSKVSRGELSGAVLLAALYVMKCKTINIQELPSSPSPDPEDMPTIDGVLQHPLVHVVSRDDSAGIYEVRIGALLTTIKIKLERRTPAGDTVYSLSHIIRVGEEPSPFPCIGLDFSPVRCLRRALDRLTKYYEGVVSAGHTPSEDWVRPC